MTSLYSCKSEIDALGTLRHRITKFDSDMNVEASYIVNGDHCSCPAGERPSCRHRKMLPRFIARGAVNTFWLLDYERQGWVSTDFNEAVVASFGVSEAEISRPAEQSPVFECPECSADLSVETHTQDCTQSWRVPYDEPLAIAHEITLPMDATSEQVAEAFAGLRFNKDYSNSMGQSPAAKALAPAPLNRRGF